MKQRTLRIFLPLLFVAVVFITMARPAFDLRALSEPASQNQSRPKKTETKQSGEQKLVYMRADNIYSIAVGDSMATCMVGNFAALHNGAVITCDSAVRYDGQTFECFGNVLINQNTTYIYGDRADYQGRKSKVEVYSPLVKVVDGDATLYTFRFTFNTYTQVGEFSGGGVLFNRGNQLEAERGYYLSDDHTISCVGRVEMRDSTYEMLSDSVSYNTDLDHANFYLNTHIWNDDGDFLSGDEGCYERPQERYLITRKGYILTAKEELWSDSLDYDKVSEHILLHGNIQIDDTEHMTLSFGDYGEYYREPGSALLTRNPALVGYDTTQGDTVFMRSDTIIYLTTFTTQPEFNPWAPQPVRDTLSTLEMPAVEGNAATAPVSEVTRKSEHSAGTPEQAQRKRGNDAIPNKKEHAPKVDSPREEALLKEHAPHISDAEPQMESLDSLVDVRAVTEHVTADSLRATALDSIFADSLPQVDTRDSLQRLTDSLDTLSVKARKGYYKRVAREKKAAEKAVKEAARREKLKVIARARQAKLTAQLNRMDSLEKLRMERRRARLAAKLAAKREKAIRKGKALPDSTALAALDSLIDVRAVADSLSHRPDSLLATVDSLAVDSLVMDSLATDSLLLKLDTVRRILKGFRHVRIYRSDFQAVCDSIVGLGVDSTLHLYIDPILWNEQNQVTSDLMDVYTDNGAVDYINFIGRPIMVSKIDTAYYNQISGKEMTAWFRANEIYRHDVNGNVETVYFLQDSPEEPVNSVFVVRSGTASFYMENKQVVSMTYREQNEYTMSPIEKVASMDELFLKEYKWLPERRPVRDSVFKRAIRPSQRDRVARQPRPNFPISDKIIRYRDRLLETGRWADRDELLSLDVQEWVRSKGFEPSQPRKEFR